MEKALITTVIPTYKRSDSLKKAIFSALNQTFHGMEVLVCDNASNDETEEVVQAIAKNDIRLKYFCHSSTIDVVQNFQFGLSKVQTPFFSILADDDLLVPDFYETALSSFARYPQSSFFLGSTLDVKENGILISANALLWEREYYEPPFGLFPVIEKYFNWTGALFRKDVLHKVQLDPGVKAVDFDFVLRLASHFAFSISKKTCALFISHSRSYSSFCGAKLLWPSGLKIVQNLEENPFLPLAIKIKAKEMLMKKIQERLISIAVNLISFKRLNDADKVIKICREEFSPSKMVRVLSFISPVLQKMAPFHFLFQMFLSIHRIKKRIFIQWKYGSFAKRVMFGILREPKPVPK